MSFVVIIGIDKPSAKAAITSLMAAGHDANLVNSIESLHLVLNLSERPVDLVFMGTENIQPEQAVDFIMKLRRNPDFHGRIVAVTGTPDLADAYIMAGCSDYIWPPQPQLFLDCAKDIAKRTLH